MNQPIHTTIKPIAKTAPERFDLTWVMIESLCGSAARADGNSVSVYGVFLLNGQTAQDMATALTIVLTCRTFAPGVFEKNENGRWQRAGANPKYDNVEGC